MGCCRIAEQQIIVNYIFPLPLVTNTLTIVRDISFGVATSRATVSQASPNNGQIV